MTDKTSTGKHLLSTRRLDQASKIKRKPDLTRSHGESNGLRVHGLLFGLIALIVLIAAIVAIAVASGTMM